MIHILRRRSPHSGRLERWLGADRIETLAGHMRNGGGPGNRWYGDPINIRDCPGSVWISGDGDFVGDFDRGFFASAADSLADHFRNLWKAAGKPIFAEQHRLGPSFGAGFPDISDALSRSSSGAGEDIGPIAKIGSTGVAAVASSLWRSGNVPVSGSTPSAAPGGRAPTKATTGAISFTNPASGTIHLTGADLSANIVNNCICLYDRIFDVAKTMNSTAAEAVTGVPTRYQNTTELAPDYIGGNFVFVEVGGTALAATAHNWTPINYKDQADAARVLPSITGNSGAIVDRFDMPVGSWFAPLEATAGQRGVKALTNIQASAAVATGAINFVIGHAIGIMAFPVVSSLLPFDWLTNKRQAPRIFNDACLAFFEFPKPNTSATTYTGWMSFTHAAP